MRPPLGHTRDVPRDDLRAVLTVLITILRDHVLNLLDGANCFEG